MTNSIDRRAEDRRYREAHPEAISRRKKAWYQMNKQKHYETTLTWQKNNPEKVRLAGFKCRLKRLGIDVSALPPKPEQCPMCQLTKQIVFDHCHASKQFRGWICNDCNLTLGRAKDNPTTLRNLAAYLERK